MLDISDLFNRQTPLVKNGGRKRWPIVTIAFGVMFVVVYAVQLFIDGSLSQDAGYQTASYIKETVGSGSVVFSWLFHSSHSHFVGNMTAFLLTGWWVENRITDDHFILGVAIVLGIGANVVAALLFQIPGAGISGITTGLVTLVAFGTFEGLVDPTAGVVKTVFQFTCSVVYALLSIGVIIPLPAGTAVEIHFIGALFGAAWFAIEKAHYNFNYSLAPKNR